MTNSQQKTNEILDDLIGRQLRYTVRRRGEDATEAIYGKLVAADLADGEGGEYVILRIDLDENGRSRAIRHVHLDQVIGVQRSKRAVEFFLFNRDGLPDIVCLAWDEAAFQLAPEGGLGWRLLRSHDERAQAIGSALSDLDGELVRMLVFEDDGLGVLQGPVEYLGILDRTRVSGYVKTNVTLTLREDVDYPGYEDYTLSFDGDEVFSYCRGKR
jgi:hypothetical protein